MLFSLLLASACATTTSRPIANIPATRHQIDDAIAADPAITRRTADFQYEAVAPGTSAADPSSQLTPSRKITAMGRVTPDRAVVYTHPGTRKLEETWVREPDGWRLARVKELGGTISTSASR